MPKFDSNYIKNAVAKKNIAQQRFKILVNEAKSPVSTTFEQKTGLLNHRKLLSPDHTSNRAYENNSLKTPIINVTKLN